MELGIAVGDISIDRGVVAPVCQEQANFAEFGHETNGLQSLEPIFDKPDGGRGVVLSEFLNQVLESLGFGLFEGFAEELGRGEFDALLLEKLEDKALFFGGDDDGVDGAEVLEAIDHAGIEAVEG